MSSIDTSFDHIASLILFFVNVCVVGGAFLCLVSWSLSLSSSSPSTTSSTTTPPSTSVFSNKSINFATIILFFAYMLSPLATDQSGLHDVIKGTDPLLDDIIERVPSMMEGPTTNFLFSNRHIQFVPWLIQNELHREGIPFQRINFEVTACIDKSQGGDCTPSPVMNDTISLDIFPPLQSEDSTYNQNFNKSSPVIIFVPGLRCYSQDMPGNMIIRRAFGSGFRSIVINRRGHTPGQLLKAPRFNLFGDVDDMEQVYWYIKHNLADPNTPVFLHGISSGTAVTVSALASWDKRRVEQPDKLSPSFVASISITPGYDTSKALRPDRFKEPYNSLLTPMVKQHFVVKNERVLRSFNTEAVDAALQAKSLQEFVDAAAPFAGYPNATEYYKYENPINEMRYISTPKLVLNSCDDPCCDIQNLYEQSPYDHHEGKTFAQQVTETKRAMVAVTKAGSHCPFLKGPFLSFVKDPLFGGWMLDSWADHVSIDYYRAALEIYGDRRFL